MAVSQSASCSSIDLAGVPARILEALAGLVAVCREPLASAPCAAAFEEAELRVRESVNALGCEVLGAWVEGLDDGALRVERGGQCWFRVPATAKTIMSTLGPVTYSRARYRHGAERASLVPVDEGLGLVNDYLTRPAARLGLMMVGHGTAREAEAFFSEMGAMRPSASTLQRLACSLHERWETLEPQAMDAVRDREDIPPEAVSASVSLDGVMVALRAGEDGRDEACWREAACGTVSFHDAEGERLRTLYFARMPESGKPTLKAQLASEVAHIRQARPDIAVVAVARACPCEGGGRPRQLDLPGEPLARGRGGRLLARLRAPPHSLRPCRRSPLVRDIPPCPAPRPARRRQGDPGAALSPRQGRQQPRRAQRRRARTRFLPQAPQAHAIPRPQRPAPRHRLRRRRGRQQNTRHTENEALRHAMAHPRRPGRPHRPRPHQIRALRPRLERPHGQGRYPRKRQHPHRQRRQAGRVKPEPQASDIIAMPDSRPKRWARSYLQEIENGDTELWLLWVDGGRHTLIEVNVDDRSVSQCETRDGETPAFTPTLARAILSALDASGDDNEAFSQIGVFSVFGNAPPPETEEYELDDGRRLRLWTFPEEKEIVAAVRHGPVGESWSRLRRQGGGRVVPTFGLARRRRSRLQHRPPRWKEDRWGDGFGLGELFDLMLTQPRILQKLRTVDG